MNKQTRAWRDEQRAYMVTVKIAADVRRAVCDAASSPHEAEAAYQQFHRTEALAAATVAAAYDAIPPRPRRGS